MQPRQGPEWSRPAGRQLVSVGLHTTRKLEDVTNEGVAVPCGEKVGLREPYFS